MGTCKSWRWTHLGTQVLTHLPESPKCSLFSSQRGFAAETVPHARKTALSPCSSTALSRFSHNKNTFHQKNGNVVKGTTVIKWNWFPCWQATAACAVYNISEVYLSTKVHFRRIFSTAPELHYLKKKHQVVISIVYNKELTEVRTRDLHVTGVELITHRGCDLHWLWTSHCLPALYHTAWKFSLLVTSTCDGFIVV